MTAALDGRDIVLPDDVKTVAIPALAHRVTLRPELSVHQVQAADVVRECLTAVPVPATEFERRLAAQLDWAHAMRLAAAPAAETANCADGLCCPVV